MAKKRAKKPSRRLTLTAVRKALSSCYGNVSAAAEALGVTRAAVHYHIQRNVDLEVMVNDQREKVADVAETKLYQAVLAGEKWAIVLALKHSRRGQERGYGAHQKVEVAGGIDINETSDEGASEAVSSVAAWLEREGISQPSTGSD